VLLHSDSSAAVAFAARPQPCATDDVERKLGRQVDSMRVRGVPPDLLDAGGFVIGVNLVAAVAAQCLVSKHVAADTGSLRLEPR
jgi:hypothetical protein